MTLSAFRHDVRYAARALRTTPAFSMATIFVLAVGIAAVATTWGVFATVVLDAVPGPHGSQMVTVSFASPAVPSMRSPLTAPAVDELRAHTAVFDEVASYQTTHPVLLRADNSDREVVPLFVSARFFPAFSVPPITGRWLADQDLLPGHDRVAVLSERLWREAFDGDSSITGRMVAVDGQPYTIVGVMPRSFGVPRPDVGIWMPESLVRPEFRSAAARMERTVARVRSGVSIDRAAEYVARLVPPIDRHSSVALRYEVTALRDTLVGPVERVLRLFIAAVALVLLIACANAAILLLIRANTRSRDAAIRLALGAGRARLAGFAAAEVCLLAAAGAALGIVLTTAATVLVKAWRPPDIPRLAELTMDLRTVGVVIVSTGLAAIMSGIVPIVRGTRASLDTRMRLQPSNARLQTAFILGQATLLVVLTVGAGLLLRSTWKLLTLDVGFDARNVVAIQFKGLRVRERDAVLTQARNAVSTVPGVQIASSTMLAPGQRGGFFTDLAAERRSGDWYVEPRHVFYQTADERYFQAMGISIVRGRSVLASDVHGAPCVAVVNEALAQDAWHGQDPIGQHVDLNVDITSLTRTDPPQLCNVVGVARNARFHLEADPEPFIYFSAHQRDELMRALVLRGARPGFP